MAEGFECPAIYSKEQMIYNKTKDISLLKSLKDIPKYKFEWSKRPSNNHNLSNFHPKNPISLNNWARKLIFF